MVTRAIARLQFAFVRKLPQQARSRATVDRIIDAAQRILARDGYAALSTNRVAEAAGVSPGSLYQYFPDKHAIVESLIERSWQRISDEVAASLADRLGDTGPDAARGVIEALISALERHREILRVMSQDLPASAHADRAGALERRIRDLVAAYLALRPATTGTPIARSPVAAAWLVTIGVSGLATRWVLDQPTAVDRDTFVDEMARLWGAYVAAPSAPAP